VVSTTITAAAGCGHGVTDGPAEGRQGGSRFEWQTAFAGGGGLLPLGGKRLSPG